MSRAIIIILCVSLAGFSARKEEDVASKQRELNALKAEVAQARNKLEGEIASRWEAKQRYVGQRENDKEELSELRDKQELAYRELSRAKEECFARERMLEDARKELASVQDSWRYVGTTVEELCARQADRVLDAFPLDREERRMDIENIRLDLQKDGNDRKAYENLIVHMAQVIKQNLLLTVGKASVIPEEGGAQQLTIARFGSVFAYGMNSANEIYFIRQTGQLGKLRFTIEKVTDPDLVAELAAKFPSWVSQNKISGDVPVDVLQNAQSRALTSGEQAKPAARLREYFRSGGPVMVPLLLLPIWAIILIILKLIELAQKRAAGNRVSREVLAHLEKSEIDKAKQIAGKSKGLVANVIGVCLDHSEWDRETAENAVTDIMAQQLPQLGKHLNTLAVIAGVAPLLGLLGTVTGMINLFEVITNYGTGDPKIMAGGISEALITTQTGLSIAIPILLVHNYLRNRKNQLQAQMEQSAIEVLNKLWPRKKGD